MPNFSGLWTVRQQMQAIGLNKWPQIPGPPTNITAIKGNSQATISWEVPAMLGYPSTITQYKITSNPGNIVVTTSNLTAVVTGLTNYISYTFTVTAANSSGISNLSLPSNSATPDDVGQQEYLNAGTYSWIAPAGVNLVSVVCIGGGGSGDGLNGGGGGGLGYKNNISVTPGSSYTVVVGAGGYRGGGSSAAISGGDSYFINTSTVRGGGGSAAISGGTYTGDGGGNGGNGGYQNYHYAAGGGAGGYSGKGGNGGSGTGSGNIPQNGFDGTGGGAGGGAAGGGSGGGGGTGLLGEGANGIGGQAASSGWPLTSAGGGSGGPNGNSIIDGAAQGGGSGGASTGNRGVGGSGAVRIIWKGSSGITRTFPSTNTGNI